MFRILWCLIRFNYSPVSTPSPPHTSLCPHPIYFSTRCCNRTICHFVTIMKTFAHVQQQQQKQWGNKWKIVKICKLRSQRNKQMHSKKKKEKQRQQQHAISKQIYKNIYKQTYIHILYYYIVYTCICNGTCR